MLIKYGAICMIVVNLMMNSVNLKCNKSIKRFLLKWHFSNTDLSDGSSMGTCVMCHNCLTNTSQIHVIHLFGLGAAVV